MRLRHVCSIAMMAWAVAMVVAALWLWGEAGQMAWSWKASQPMVLTWGIRCGAVGLGAAAQVLALSVLVHYVYRRDVVSDILRLAGLLVFMVAGVSAIALGLAGR